MTSFFQSLWSPLLISLLSTLACQAAHAGGGATIAARAQAAEATPSAAQPASNEPKGTETVYYDPADPEIQQAVKQARATLDTFFKNTGMSNALATNVALKIEVRDGKVREYLWVTPFEVLDKDNKRFQGTLNDIAQKVKNVSTGQQVSFGRADIVDWSYTDLHERRLKGNFTTCVMLRRGPEQERQVLKASYGLDCDKP